MTDFRQKQGTTVEWLASGGDYLLTPTSLANNNGRKGAGADLGAVFPVRMRWEFETVFAAGVSDGSPLLIGWASSVDNSLFDGNLSAGDAAMNDEDTFNYKIQLIGTFPGENDTNTQVKSGIFFPPARYGFPVIFNKSGQALSSTAGDHAFRLTPLTDTDD
jgi:hypothetical protein